MVRLGSWASFLLCVSYYLHVGGAIAGITVAVVVIALVALVVTILAVVIYKRKWIQNILKRGIVITAFLLVSPLFLIHVHFPTHVGQRSSTPTSRTEEGRHEGSVGLNGIPDLELEAEQEELSKDDNKCEYFANICLLVLYMYVR